MMDRIKYYILENKLTLSAALTSTALLIAVMIHTDGKLLGMTIATGIASFAGASAAFGFEKRERENLKYIADKNSLLLIKEYFELEKIALEYVAKELQEELEQNCIYVAPSLNSKFKISHDKFAFMLDYEPKLFTQSINTATYVGVCEFGAEHLRKLTEEYTCEVENKEEAADRMLAQMKANISGARKGIEMIDSTLGSLNQFNHDYFSD